jgi:hypothetical protein
VQSRDYIPLRTKLASVLADRLPAAQRRALMEKRATDADILALFEWDHLKYHAWGKGDPDINAWWNLDAKTEAAHDEKFAADMAILAKARRIEEKREAELEAEQSNFRHRTLTKQIEPSPLRSKPKRKWASRPMPGSKRSGFKCALTAQGPKWERRK